MIRSIDEIKKSVGELETASSGIFNWIKETFSNDQKNDTTDIFENIKGPFNKKSTEEVQLDGLLGMPPIFSRNADMTKKGANEYGYKWSDVFLKYGNICAIEVGQPKLIGGNMKKKLLNFLFNDTHNDSMSDTQKEEFRSSLQKGKTQKLISFKRNMTRYFDYVDLMAEYFQNLLNITPPSGNLLFAGWNKRPGTTYSGYAASYLNQIAGRGGFSAEDGKVKTVNGRKVKRPVWHFVSFYHNGPIEKDFSLSHGTKESTMFSMLQNNALKDRASEFAFLSGSTVSNLVTDGKEVDNKGMMAQAGDKLKGMFGFGAKIAGTNIVSPKVWEGADFEKSVDLNFVFQSPYADPISIYKYVYLPLAHLIPFTFPTQVSAIDADFVGALGSYGPPMVVRFYAKGAEQIQLGIVTNISIKKDPMSITPLGLAKRLEVTVSIADLYGVMGIPEVPMLQSLKHTIGFNEFMCTMAGTMLIEDELTSILSSITDWGSDIVRNWKSLPSDAISKYHDFQSNIMNEILSRAGRS